MRRFKINYKLIYFIAASCLILDLIIDYRFNKTLKSPSKINACIFILARNRDIATLKETIKLFELQFNNKHNYPYVLMNDEEFTTEFKSEIVKYTNSLVEFGQIDKGNWKVPDWINQTEMYVRFNTSLKNVPKANIVSYHHMCRYYSGFFFRHNLTLKYDYYWRLDHQVDFPCEIKDDPFEILVREKKLYGFVMFGNEYMESIPTLWPTLNKWLSINGKIKEQMSKTNSKELVITDKEGLQVNNCQFWSNFEVASFSIYRNENYLSYFDYLDKAGGFYYERWGDAPVHSYYVMLMLSRYDVIRFENIGYGHDGLYNVPIVKTINCTSLISKDYVLKFGENCRKKWYEMI